MVDKASTTQYPNRAVQLLPVCAPTPAGRVQNGRTQPALSVVHWMPYFIQYDDFLFGTIYWIYFLAIATVSAIISYIMLLI